MIYRCDDIRALAFVREKIGKAMEIMLQGGPVAIELQRPTRSLDQNRKLWPMLQDISRQVIWHGQRLTREEWKDVLTASLKGQKCVPGIESGLVFFGTRTSTMSKAEFSELIELIYSFGAERGVQWSEPAQAMFDEHGRRVA